VSSEGPVTDYCELKIVGTKRRADDAKVGIARKFFVENVY